MTIMVVETGGSRNSRGREIT